MLMRYLFQHRTSNEFLGFFSAWGPWRNRESSLDEEGNFATHFLTHYPMFHLIHTSIFKTVYTIYLT